MWRDGHPSFEVEDAKIVHPNVLSFKLVTEGGPIFVVGGYLPPETSRYWRGFRRPLTVRRRGCLL